MQFPGFKVVIFNGVARSGDVGPLETLDGMHQRNLHIVGQAGADAVWIQLSGSQAFRFDKNLVRQLVGKADYLVLNRRAVTWSYAFDHARVKRRPVEAPANNVVSLFAGMGNEAGDLRRMIFPG